LGGSVSSLIATAFILGIEYLKISFNEALKRVWASPHQPMAKPKKKISKKKSPVRQR